MMPRLTLFLFLLSALFLSASLSAQSLKIEYSEDDDDIESVEEDDDEPARDKKKKHKFELDTQKGRIYYYDSESKKRHSKPRRKWYHRLDGYYDDLPLFFPEKRPTVSVAFGTQGSIYTAPNAPIAFTYFDASLGYINERISSFAPNSVFKYGHQYLFLSNQTNVDMSLSFNALTGIESNVWRVGLGSKQGYGYRSGQFSLTPYHGNAAVWTNIGYTNFASLSESEQRLLSDFNNAVRFGSMTEGGVRLGFVEPIALDVSFQRTVVMRRFVFWQWLGSYGLESLSQSLLDGFIREIYKSSPAFAPIMNFALKNALAYGIYQLRRENMNTPFESEAPIHFDMFRIGLTFSF
ncbi:MAG: hypothetical protein SNJ55_01885 [Chloroherpetonaceae bacterium]